ncbi:hypothetical protein YEEN111655_16500 [Yersinia entomophaga]
MWAKFKSWYMAATVSYSTLALGLTFTGMASLVGIAYLIYECF